MPRERSPNYPSVVLEQALNDAQALFKRESKSAVPPEVAVKAWGYAGLNGAARTRLAALRHYGLIDAERSGNVRLSRRGLTLAMRSADSPEYATALREAALSPAIFQELHAKNGSSDEALAHYLAVDRSFSPDGAKRAIEAYRAAVEFAKLDAGRYNEGIEEESDMPEAGRSDGRAHSQGSVLPRDGQFYRVPLSNGVTAELTFQGNRVTRRELQLLRRYLELAELALEDDSSGAAGGPGTGQPPSFNEQG